MKKIATKKLSLDAQTIRSLDPQDGRAVAGGMVVVSEWSGPASVCYCRTDGCLSFIWTCR
jgi:hypothetical protein